MKHLYDVPAPAKLNLFLHVTGRREDGYHLLQTVFVFIDLADQLQFELRNDGVICRQTSLPGIDHESDLIVRAARALQKATGTAQGATIHVQKNIPAGGGLGGGSSDAASTLVALNRLWKTGLSRWELQQLALPLGADVPVFVFGQNTFAEGIGEAFTACRVPKQAYLVFQPRLGISTPAIFTDPGLCRDTPLVTVQDVQQSLSLPVPETSLISQPAFFGHNDLETVACRQHPGLQQLVDWLAARQVKARMTGSGACFFAPFPSYADALRAKHGLDANLPAFNQEVSVPVERLIAARGLARHPLYDWVKN
ncbi:4-(cytidine 5'-diphospho)-2-C-methyl-D-erythritol kinase [Advenella sp. WQ 585]|uniref:4-diphosphocytidyl-2-C-methyl-D-erythritol kinase n=1 Tax=Advenella mandrilli TaxID=2800330 RepID=A0ABS1EEM5_9BURK|nr:4-(cytidine 5'-diphospho)-2-C-methyl-D-erythritol kinase [Advenella mandrilli]MBK1781668.1 4-(cytidine 5'-diphospho)-2-C-methyl-D-erythritol kinase [Advenella mandrilli]